MLAPMVLYIHLSHWHSKIDHRISLTIDVLTVAMAPLTGAVLASQAEAIVYRGETWPQATKRRTGD